MPPSEHRATPMQYWAALLAFVVTVGTVSIYGYIYKTKIDDLDVKIAKLESAQASLTGLRGQEGPPGKQGDKGDKGDRGIPGVSPERLTEIEKKISELSNLSARSANSERNRQAAPLNESSSIAEPLGEFRRHSSGCKFLPLTFETFSFTMHGGDRFCDANGDRVTVVKKIDERMIYFSMGNDCPKMYGCTAYFNSRAAISIKEIEVDKKDQIFAVVTFSQR